MAGCVYCDRPRLDGHLTCGSAGCSESDARDDQQGFWIAASLDCTSTVVTKDGRRVDVSGLTFEEVCARLRALGVDMDQIARTEHSIPRGAVVH